jgi:hypothetical protein
MQNEYALAQLNKYVIILYILIDVFMRFASKWSV